MIRDARYQAGYMKEPIERNYDRRPEETPIGKGLLHSQKESSWAYRQKIKSVNEEDMVATCLLEIMDKSLHSLDFEIGVLQDKLEPVLISMGYPDEPADVQGVSDQHSDVVLKLAVLNERIRDLTYKLAIIKERVEL
jgi:hypothetical protein